MEVQTIDTSFKVDTDKGITKLCKTNFADTSKIVEDFVNPKDIEFGVTDFYVLKEDFVQICKETKKHNNGMIQFYSSEDKPIFKIHSIL